MVSIGLPVFNGDNFLEQALESLLAQNFTDFELIISDNASTDRTEEICTSYAARDTRIRYYRSDVNRGASWNFNNLVSLARGKYFMWAAHDDLWAVDFIASCVERLEADPSALLCYTATQVIDHTGRNFREIRINPRLAAGTAYERFAAVWRYPPQVPVFGLMRTDGLRRTRLIGNFSSSDRVLAAELALHGRLEGIDRPLFLYRRHDSQSTGSQYLARQSRAAWYDPRKAGKATFPRWRLLREHFISIMRAPLTIGSRMHCLLALARWIVRYRRELLWNLILQDGRKRKPRGNRVSEA